MMCGASRVRVGFAPQADGHADRPMDTPQHTMTAADTPPFPGQGGASGAAGAAAVDAFIARWGSSAGAERANYQIFLAELCDLLGVPRPDPSVADEASNTYVFDKAVTPVRKGPARTQR